MDSGDLVDEEYERHFSPGYTALRDVRIWELRDRLRALNEEHAARTGDLEDQIAALLSEEDKGSSGESVSEDFRTPLYRPNLRYRVFEKPARSEKLLQHMVGYILEHHAGESGIVYCYRRDEAEAVAAALNEKSGGQISTGVYHAGIKDELKEHLHERWRSGHIQVVCATTAFIHGVSKADVRFVLHHTMSKSLESYYEESGRAGRDGKESACVLYVRPQDAGGCASLVHDSVDTRKLEGMLRFGLDVETCRKIAFAQHFSAEADISPSPPDALLNGTLTACGHCDNCTRDPDSVTERDITLDAWRALRIADAAGAVGAKLTLKELADALRGAGEKTKTYNLTVVGGTSPLSPRDAELTIAWLLLDGYLKQDYVQIPYPTQERTVNYRTIAYLVPGESATSVMEIRSAEESEGWPTRITIKCISAETVPRMSTGSANKGKGKQKKDVSLAKRKRVPQSETDGFESEEDERGGDERDDDEQPESPRKRVKSVKFMFSNSEHEPECATSLSTPQRQTTPRSPLTPSYAPGSSRNVLGSPRKVFDRGWSVLTPPTTPAAATTRAGVLARGNIGDVIDLTLGSSDSDELPVWPKTSRAVHTKSRAPGTRAAKSTTSVGPRVPNVARKR